MPLISIETQREFPRKDISDDAAAMLELLLLNPQLVDLYHESAERVSFLYKIGHQTLDLMAGPRINNEMRTGAFSYGIGMFEAVSALVHPLRIDEDSIDEGTATLHIMTVNGALGDAFVSTLMDARERFKEELPRTSQVIGECAARLCRDYPDYAMMGAAIAREVELHTLPE